MSRLKTGKQPKLVISDWLLARLVQMAIREINAKNKERQIPVLKVPQIKEFINRHYENALNNVVNSGNAHIFQDQRLGKVQVLQVSSKKDYQWDQKYNGNDWIIKFFNDMNLIKFEVDNRWYDKVIEKVDSGKEYSEQEITTDDNLDKLLTALNGEHRTRFW